MKDNLALGEVTHVDERLAPIRKTCFQRHPGFCVTAHADIKKLVHAMADTLLAFKATSLTAAAKEDFSLAMNKKPIIELGIAGLADDALLELPAVSYWGLSRMKLRPRVQVWVRWMPTENPNIIALDRTHGRFDGGMQFVFTHELVVMLAKMLKIDGGLNKEAVITTTVLETTAVGTMRRSIDAREACACCF